MFHSDELLKLYISFIVFLKLLKKNDRKAFEAIFLLMPGIPFSYLMYLFGIQMVCGV